MLNTIYLKKRRKKKKKLPETSPFAPLFPEHRAAPWASGNGVRAQGPARPRLAVSHVQHDDTAVQTDMAEDAGLIAWHHLHEHKLPHTVPLLSPPSLTFSALPLHSFHCDPATLNPPSTRRHGRQAATQTGDRKQLINMVTPLHLPGPTRGGELSASKTKQPSTHSHTYTHSCVGEWLTS